MPTLTARLAPFAQHVVSRRGCATVAPRLYVGRPTRWGNPFPLHREQDRLAVVTQYARHLAAMPAAQRIGLLLPIRAHLVAGGALECFCAPRLCHAQVLAAWALSDPAVAAADRQARHP